MALADAVRFADAGLHTLQAVRSQLALSWGIETYLTPAPRHTDHYAMQVDQTLLSNGVLREGDLVVIVAGSPPGIPA